jgi:hypothetical protein
MNKSILIALILLCAVECTIKHVHSETKPDLKHDLGLIN